MIYLRVLNPDAWMEVMSNDRNPLDADVISDLSTQNHELSVWAVNDDLHDLEDVILAMALTRNQIRDLALVKLSPEIMKDSKFFNGYPDISEQPGDTGYSEMKDSHKNFMIESLWEMGFLAEFISDLIINDFDNSFILYNSSDIVKILHDKLNNGTITESSLSKEKCSKWIRESKKFA